MVLGKLPVPGRPTILIDSRARAYCACSRCGWGLFGHFYSHLSFLLFLPLFGRVARKSPETDPTKFKIPPKTPRGKKDSTKDTIIDITSDSQVNSNLPNRRPQASLTFNNYFYLFLY